MARFGWCFSLLFMTVLLALMVLASEPCADDFDCVNGDSDTGTTTYSSGGRSIRGYSSLKVESAEPESTWLQKIPPVPEGVVLADDPKRNQALHKYIQWLHERGQWSEKLELTIDDKGQIVILAAKNLKAGEIILKQKNECVITGEAALKDNSISALKSALQEGETTLTSLALVMFHIVQHRKADSLYSPYYDILPETPIGFFHWPEDVVARLNNTIFGGIREDRMKYFTTQYDNLKPNIFEKYKQIFPEPVSFETFLHWCRIVASRIPFDSGVATLPCAADLLRHSSDGAKLIIEDEIARVVLVNDVQKGEEIFLNYYPTTTNIEVALSFDSLPVNPVMFIPYARFFEPTGSMIQLGAIAHEPPVALPLGIQDTMLHLMTSLRLLTLTHKDVPGTNSTINPNYAITPLNEFRAIRQGLKLFHKLEEALPSAEQLSIESEAEKHPIRNLVARLQSFEHQICKAVQRAFREQWQQLLH